MSSASLPAAPAAWGARRPPPALGPDEHPHPCAICRCAPFTRDRWPDGLHPCDDCGGWHYVCRLCLRDHPLLGGRPPEDACAREGDATAPLAICPDAALAALALRDEADLRAMGLAALRP